MTTLGSLPVFLLAAQAVLVREDLVFGEPQLGLAVSVFFAAAALSSLTAGAVVERMGRRTGTILAGSISAVDAFLIAAGAHTYAVLLGLLVLAGVANAALQMTANIALARSVPRGRQGLAFGIKQSAVQVAVLVGGLAVPTVGVVVGWRWTFVAAGVGAVVVVVAGLRLPKGGSGRQEDEKERDRPPVGALVVSAAAMALASASVNSLGSFLPTWAFEVGLTPGEAGLLVALGSGICVAVRILSGARADRRRGRNLPVVASYVAIGAVGLVLVSFSTLPTLLLGAIVAFGIGWAWPGLFLFAVVRVGRDSPGTASGAVQAGAFAGGAAGPALFGLLVAATSFPVAWRTAAVFLLVAALLLMVVRRMFLVDLTRRPPRTPLDSAVAGEG